MFVNDRLHQQIQFLREIDDLKQILRQTVLTKDKRQENDAEHSWHLAMLVMILSEYSNDTSIDLLRTLKMVLIHDLVEIDAGDTFCYDEQGRDGKVEREREAAHRIFSILPSEQFQEYLDLWEEFEAMETPEAQFAAAVDRVQPLLLNLYSEGHAWKKHGVNKSQVIERNHHIAKGSKVLWEFAQNLINEAVKRGYLIDE
ncbi:HD domain-containing protein [Candidatus Thorarchaeota archaeon]|nr:MAG: HD domain-containing protein [Candidatus Thorarchaeota archaeon]